MKIQLFETIEECQEHIDSVGGGPVEFYTKAVFFEGMNLYVAAYMDNKEPVLESS